MSAHFVDTGKVPAVLPPGGPQHAPSRGSQRAGSVVRGGPTVSVPLAAGAIAARVPNATAPANVSVAPVDRRAVLATVRRDRRERHRLAALSIMGLLAALGATVLLLDVVH